MLTWKLFWHVLVAFNAYDNPFYLRETSHYPVWHKFVYQTVRSEVVQTGIVSVGVFTWVVGVLFFNNLLFALIPSLLLLMVAVSLVVGPLIVEEREKQSWELLLATQASLETILLGKLGGALWHVRHLVYMMTAFLFLFAAGAGFISLILIPVGTIGDQAWNEVSLCGFFLIVPIAGSVIFVVDRIQQFLLMLVSGFAAGTSSSSVRNALAMSFTTLMLIWLLEIASTEILLVWQHGQGAQLTVNHLLALGTLGPMLNFVLDMPPSGVPYYILLMLVAREILLNIVWRWGIWRASI